jgi:hypothetical protein
MELRQIAPEQVSGFTPGHGLDMIALLAEEAIDFFVAAGVEFAREPQAFGSSGRPWAALEAPDGRHYVLTLHEPRRRIAVRTPGPVVSVSDLVREFCAAAGLAPDLARGATSGPDDGLRAARGPGFMSRLRDRHMWPYIQLISGQPRNRISARAMNRLPSGRTSYAPIPTPGDSGKGRRRRNR